MNYKDFCETNLEEEEDENTELVYLKTASVPWVETEKSTSTDDDIDVDAL